MQKRFVLISAALTLLILVGGVLLLSKGSRQESSIQTPSSYEYYWSKTCPHCSNVNEFMESWSGKDKVQIAKYEVTETRENTIKFIQRGEYCKFPKAELGVPFLVTPNGLCLSGDQPIIDHFKGLILE